MAAERAHNSLNIADLMESLTVSKKEADVMEVEIKAVTRDLSRPNTIASLSRLEAEINKEIGELIKKRKTLEGTLERDERRMKRANANERLKLQTDKLDLLSSIRKIDALLADYREKLKEVSDPLERMKRYAIKEKAKHEAIIKKATKDMTPKDKKEFIVKYKQYLRDVEGITIEFGTAFNNSNSNGASAAATRRHRSRTRSTSPRGAAASRRHRSRSKSRSPSNMPNSPRSHGGATRRRRNNRSTRRK